jgi:hypothetical protein
MQCQKPAGAYEGASPSPHAGGGVVQTTSFALTVDGGVSPGEIVPGVFVGVATPEEGVPGALGPEAGPSIGGLAAPEAGPPEKPLAGRSFGTATSPAAHTAGTQDVAVDAYVVIETDPTALPPAPVVPVVLPPPRTAGASAMPLAPSTPAEGGVTLV